MGAKRKANIYVRNDSGGPALIQLYHENASSGTDSEGWIAETGQTVGPLVVHFETGLGSRTVLDYWWVNMFPMADSKQKGFYQTEGSALFPGWKECQLWHQDADKDITFVVSTEKLDLP